MYDGYVNNCDAGCIICSQGVTCTELKLQIKMCYIFPDFVISLSKFSVSVGFGSRVCIRLM